MTPASVGFREVWLSPGGLHHVRKDLFIQKLSGAPGDRGSGSLQLSLHNLCTIIIVPILAPLPPFCISREEGRPGLKFGRQDLRSAVQGFRLQVQDEVLDMGVQGLRCVGFRVEG